MSEKIIEIILKNRGNLVENLVCIGILVGDFVMKEVKHFPERGKLSCVDTCQLHIGGCAANTGIIAKNLGVEVGIIGKIGADPIGEFIINALKKRVLIFQW